MGGIGERRDKPSRSFFFFFYSALFFFLSLLFLHCCSLLPQTHSPISYPCTPVQALTPPHEPHFQPPPFQSPSHKPFLPFSQQNKNILVVLRNPVAAGPLLLRIHRSFFIAATALMVLCERAAGGGGGPLRWRGMVLRSGRCEWINAPTYHCDSMLLRKRGEAMSEFVRVWFQETTNEARRARRDHFFFFKEAKAQETSKHRRGW